MQEKKSIIDKLSVFGVYSSNMFPPPAETLPHVIPFELTTGCSYNACSFCNMYETKHSKLNFKGFKKHVDNVWNTLEKIGEHETIDDLTRIFIGSGNALCVEEHLLQDAINYSISSFVKHVGSTPKRVAMYGNTRDINFQGSRALDRLNCGGTCGNCSIGKFGEKVSLGLLYWGIESGSDEVLQYVNKGYNQSDLFIAAHNLRSSGIRSSVMIIPGLGGKKYFDSHVLETARVLNKLEPEFITFIGLENFANCAYSKRIATETMERINRNLKSHEIVEQTAQIIERLDFDSIIGIHGRDVHPIGHNPIVLGSIEMSPNPIFDEVSPISIAKKLRKKNSRLNLFRGN
ncbi:hypothetical protein JXM83_00765 [Candidatus Woesearchaeota archaeon]|nr:hypothetical protein [Candidatus Woesearchaeota archaeon]